MTNQISLIPSFSALGVHDFEGSTIRSIEYNGEPCVFAREQGKALGYARDGSEFVNSIREWEDAGEMRQGEHVIKIEGPALALVKELHADSAGSRARHLTLLTRAGCIRAAMLAGGPAGLRFRDWAERVLFNVMTTGKHEEPGAKLKVSVSAVREARILADRINRGGDKALANAMYGELGRDWLASRGAKVPEAQIPTEPVESDTARQLGAVYKAWHQERPGVPFGSTDLLRLADGVVECLTQPSTKARAAHLGRLLAARAGQRLGGLVLRIHMEGASRRYRLVA